MGLLNLFFRKKHEPIVVDDAEEMVKVAKSVFITGGSTCKDIYDRYGIKVGIGCIKRSVFECQGLNYIKGTVNFMEYDERIQKWVVYRPYDRTIMYKNEIYSQVTYNEKWREWQLI